MPTTSNFGWTTPADTDLVKDGAAAIRTLGNGIDTSFLDLKGGTTGQVLSKASNTDLDFSWVAQDDSNAIQNAIVDAKGDLISATAADTPARLAVGANGTILTADSSEATGLKWAAPSTGALTLLKKETFSAVSSVSIGSNASPLFSSTYDNYYINFIGTTSGNAGLFFRLRANTTDATTNYTRQNFEVVNNTTYTGSSSSQTSGFFGSVRTDRSANDLWLYSPYLSTQTIIYCTNNGGAGDAVGIQNTRHTDSTSYNGITVFPTSPQTITGTLLIYGFGQ
jgi:hypothetical protein